MVIESKSESYEDLLFGVMNSHLVLSSWRKALLIILVGTGLILSVVSLYQHVGYTEGYLQGASFCNISQDFNCEAVNASAWSTFFGLPIASYGIFFYLILGGFVLFRTCADLLSPTQYRGFLSLWTAVGVIFSIVLFAISKVFIGVLCPLCIANYLVNIALFTVVVSTVRKEGLLKIFKNGLKALRAVFARVKIGDRAALKSIWFISFVVFLTLVSPVVSRLFFVGQVGGESETHNVTDTKISWEDSPEFSFQLDHSGGMFGDFSKGDIRAPIHIVEFADIECPGCRKLYEDLNDLLRRYEGLYFLTFKNYPLDHRCNPTIPRLFHLHACKAALFTRCAGEQGRFWQAVDAVFVDPIIDHVNGEELVHRTLVDSIGASLGLDREALESCLSSDRYQSRLHADIREGKRAGLTATPSVWVNGKKIPTLSRQELERVFSKILVERGIATPAP